MSTVDQIAPSVNMKRRPGRPRLRMLPTVIGNGTRAASRSWITI